MVQAVASSFDIHRVVTARSGHMVALGIHYAAHGPDWVEFTIDYDRRLISDLATGILASGPIVSLMDIASGVSIWLKRGAVLKQATLDLRIDYLRPAQPGQRITGRAECYRLTRRIAFTRGMAHDGDPNDPIAHVAATFMLDAGPRLTKP